MRSLKLPSKPQNYGDPGYTRANYSCAERSLAVWGILRLVWVFSVNSAFPVATATDSAAPERKKWVNTLSVS